MGKKVGFWSKATAVLQKIFSKKVGVTTFKVGKSGLKTAKIGYPNDEKSILDIHKTAQNNHWISIKYPQK